MMKTIQELIDRCIYYRGHVINLSIVLEKDIEMYIIKHFAITPGKLNDMHEVVLQRLTFDSKIGVFYELLQRNNPSIKVEKVHSKLFADIRYIKDVRNKMAHHPMFTGYKDGDYIPKEFSLISYSNQTKTKLYTKGDFKLFNEKIYNCLAVIALL